MREKSGIEDMFDKLMREGVASDKKIEIVIPDCVFSITPSFLEELFKEIVLKYGKEVVAKRIEFKGVYEIGIAFEEALDRIELQKNGLDV